MNIKIPSFIRDELNKKNAKLKKRFTKYRQPEYIYSGESCPKCNGILWKWIHQKIFFCKTCPYKSKEKKLLDK